MKKTKKKPARTSKKQLRKAILKYFGSDDYAPIAQLELFSKCKISPKNYLICKEIVTELITEDKITTRNQLLHRVESKKEETIIGRISIHPRGFGFVAPEDIDLNIKEVFIPKGAMNGAVDKDIVEVKVVLGRKSDKGPEGVVIRICSRERKTLVGILYEQVSKGFMAHSTLLGDKKHIMVSSSKKIGLKVGDRVVLHIDEWQSNQDPNTLKAKPIKVLGSMKDATKDVLVAVHEYSLRDTFPDQAVEEAKSFPKNPRKIDLKNRADLTDVETFTIDPDTAKDYDDALSLTKDDQGHFYLIVHVADVSHYVTPGSALDDEAQARSNSTYFPNECIPMLPEALSNGLCSLKENVVRLCVSVFMHFDKEGTLLHSEVKRSYIKSQKRFTYKEAKKVIDGELLSPHSKTLELMVHLCKLLQKKRSSRGSVDLSMPDLSLKVDKMGEPIGLELIEYDVTHQLVEEFMLKANEVVAKCLIERKVPAIFRVHESPSPSDMEDFASLARSLGFKLKKNPKKEDIQELFQEVKTTPYIHQLSVAFIRSMKLAIYSENNVGHFGLSLEHYCHFTSPIRRYSDLVVHRLLFENPLSPAALQKIALHCSEKERISFRAETSVIILKKLRLLCREFDLDEDKIYEAVVSKIRPFGIYFELPFLMFEGFLHISEIGSDYYLYDEKDSRLVGEKSGETFKNGSKINVKLVHINLITQQVLWEMVRAHKKKNTKSKKR